MTADRLLEGGVAPDDAPPGYQDVARTLQAAALMASDAPTEQAATAVAAFLDAIPSRRTTRMKKWKIAAATLAGGLTLSTGLAAADVLPGAAQHAASSALSHIGVNVPSGDDDPTNVSTVEEEHKSEVKDDDATTSTTHPDNHGGTVSGVAHDDSTTGAEHGAAVCAAASDNKCKAGATHDAGEHGKSADEVHGGSANTSSHSANSREGSANSGEGSANSNGNGSSSSGSSGSGGSSTNSGSSVSGGSGGSSSSSGASTSGGSGSSSNSSSSGSGN